MPLLTAQEKAGVRSGLWTIVSSNCPGSHICAPRKLGVSLPGESPGRERFSQPPVASLAGRKEAVGAVAEQPL